MEQESWLESDENYAKWSSQKITATEKRTLITWWFGEAYKKLCSARYKDTGRVAFEVGGCAIDSLGAGDGLVRVVGLHHKPVMRTIGAPFLDEAYVNQAYTLAPNFNFAECKKKDKGGDEKDEEEDLPSDEGEEPSEAEDSSSESDSSSSA